mgnify:CR=1 FL=1
MVECSCEGNKVNAKTFQSIMSFFWVVSALLALNLMQDGVTPGILCLILSKMWEPK